MAPRHWTILIVPPGTGTPRTIRIGTRARRALVGGAVTTALLVASSIAILFTPYATPSARLLLAQNTRLQAQLDQIDKRLATLSDTLTALGARDQQIRLLADLPTKPASSVTEGPVGTDTADARIGAPTTKGVISLASLAPNSLPRPFLGRLGFSSRVDIDGMIDGVLAMRSKFLVSVSLTARKLFESSVARWIMPSMSTRLENPSRPRNGLGNEFGARLASEMTPFVVGAPMRASAVSVPTGPSVTLDAGLVGRSAKRRICWSRAPSAVSVSLSVARRLSIWSNCACSRVFCASRRRALGVAYGVNRMAIEEATSRAVVTAPPTRARRARVPMRIVRGVPVPGGTIRMVQCLGAMDC